MFIELHKPDGSAWLLNVNSITSIVDYNDCACIIANNGTEYTMTVVKETYYDIKTMLLRRGAL